MELIQKVKELITAIRAGDWVTSVQLILAILVMVTQGMSEQPPMTMKAKSDHAGEDLACKLEECIRDHEAPMTIAAEGSEALAARGPFIDMLLPILLALLKKFLGL